MTLQTVEKAVAYASSNEQDEPHMVSATEALGIEFTLYLTCGDVDIAKLKQELEEEIRVNKRRLEKATERKARDAAKRRRKGDGKYVRSGREKLENATMKYQALKAKIEILERRYWAVLAVEYNIPMNYVLSSHVFVENGRTNFLLGYEDPQIGKENHGHVVFDHDGNCIYCRFPFEAHGGGNWIPNPTSMLGAIRQKYTDQPLSQ